MTSEYQKIKDAQDEAKKAKQKELRNLDKPTKKFWFSKSTKPYLKIIFPNGKSYVLPRYCGNCGLRPTYDNPEKCQDCGQRVRALGHWLSSMNLTKAQFFQRFQ